MMNTFILLFSIISLSCKKNPTEADNIVNNVTSHNITWQIFNIGSGGSTSDLKDVAIIDENNIWAVGEFNINDSLGQTDYEPYGAANWDGEKWNYYKIKVSTLSNNYTFLSPKALLAFSDNDIWFISGGVSHFNGKKVVKSYWINYAGGNNPQAIFNSDQYLSRIWGTSLKNLYVGGTNGALARFNGTTWEKIELGTNLDILDIWGTNKDSTSLIVVAGKDYENFNKEIYLVKGTFYKKLISNNEYYFIRSIWFDGKYNATLVGTSVYTNSNILTNSSLKEIEIDRTNYALNSIRGNSANDLFIAGAYGEILHYNGESWKSYIDETHINGNYYKISVKDNLVVAVGLNNPNAVIAVGKRNK